MTEQDAKRMHELNPNLSEQAFREFDCSPVQYLATFLKKVVRARCKASKLRELSQQVWDGKISIEVAGRSCDSRLFSK